MSIAIGQICRKTDKTSEEYALILNNNSVVVLETFPFSECEKNRNQTDFLKNQPKHLKSINSVKNHIYVSNWANTVKTRIHLKE